MFYICYNLLTCPFILAVWQLSYSSSIDCISMNDQTGILSSVGQKLDAEAMHNLLTETGICSPNWEEIGNQLGWQLEGQLLAADFFDEWCANDHEASWVKLANALAKIREYQHAKSIVLEKQGMFLWWTSYDKFWIT